MKKKHRICTINVIILLIYTLGPAFLPKSHEPTHPVVTVTYFIVVAIAIITQTTINLIIGLILLAYEKKEQAQLYFISMGIVLLIGFSACIGGGIFV